MGHNNLIIRTDATSQLGAGHLMRCLALAQAWKDTGGKATFISCCDSIKLRERIFAEGFDFIALERPYPDQGDLAVTLKILSDINQRQSEWKNWIVVDGYHFDAEYQRRIKQAGCSLLCIDDFGQAKHYFADLVLNQNISADSSWYISRELYSRVLLGPRFSLLRREFINCGQRRKKISSLAHKVLVTLGGADPDRFTLKVIQALKQVNDLEMEAAVVVGPANKHFKEIESHLSQLPFPFRLLPAADNMAELMDWADIAISAGGSTSWELAFMGLPFLVVALADNQRPIAKGLGYAGIAINLGWHEEVTIEYMAQELIKVVSQKDKREEMSRRGQGLVDGQGSARVLTCLQGNTLRLRRVRQEDCKLLWDWANESTVRNSAFNSDSILWEEHKQWFAQKFHDPQCLQFIALDDMDVPIGQIRFDIHEKEAEVDVSIDEKKRSQGLGSRLIAMGISELISQGPVRWVHSFIKSENIASIRAFEKAGFKRSGEKVIKDCQALHMIWRKSE